MQKTLTVPASLLAAGIMLLGNAQAQQAPAAKPKTAAPAAKTQKAAPAAKPQSAPAAKAGTAGAGKTAGAAPLATQKEKFSYALGMNLGTNLHEQSVEVDADALARGLRDALSGGKLQMTEEEAKAALMQAQAEMRKKMQEKMQAEGAANKKEGDAYLAANKAKEGVVTLPSGLQYKILTPGTGPKPTTEDTVVCNYRGTLINGTEFDSSYKRGEPATFPIKGVIKGWSEALPLMPVGSKWQLFLPADLGYGEHSPTPSIGPNSTLIFEVELMSIQDKSKESKESPEKKSDEKTPETKSEEKK